MELLTMDYSILEKAAIAVICLFIIFFGYKVVELIVSQWKSSTDAMNNNTAAFHALSEVFRVSQQRDLEFQARVKKELERSEQRETKTLEQVSAIHKKIVEED